MADHTDEPATSALPVTTNEASSTSTKISESSATTPFLLVCQTQRHSKNGVSSVTCRVYLSAACAINKKMPTARGAHHHHSLLNPPVVTEVMCASPLPFSIDRILPYEIENKMATSTPKPNLISPREAAPNPRP